MQSWKPNLWRGWTWHDSSLPLNIPQTTKIGLVIEEGTWRRASNLIHYYPIPSAFVFLQQVESQKKKLSLKLTPCGEPAAISYNAHASFLLVPSESIWNMKFSRRNVWFPLGCNMLPPSTQSQPSQPTPPLLSRAQLHAYACGLPWVWILSAPLKHNIQNFKKMKNTVQHLALWLFE